MGKFDRKVAKNEPDAPKPKKNKSELAKVEGSRKVEKERNMKILSFMQREQEFKVK